MKPSPQVNPSQNETPHFNTTLDDQNLTASTPVSISAPSNLTCPSPCSTCGGLTFWRAIGQEIDSVLHCEICFRPPSPRLVEAKYDLITIEGELRLEEREDFETPFPGRQAKPAVKSAGKPSGKRGGYGSSMPAPAPDYAPSLADTPRERLFDEDGDTIRSIPLPKRDLCCGDNSNWRGREAIGRNGFLRFDCRVCGRFMGYLPTEKVKK